MSPSNPVAFLRRVDGSPGLAPEEEARLRAERDATEAAREAAAAKAAEEAAAAKAADEAAATKAAEERKARLVSALMLLAPLLLLPLFLSVDLVPAYTTNHDSGLLMLWAGHGLLMAWQ